ncbi:MAG: hypothetical protein WBW31_07015 [Candidatus Sulfotelmatobacter sp.]
MDASASGKPDKDKQHEYQPNDQWTAYSGANGDIDKPPTSEHNVAQVLSKLPLFLLQQSHILPGFLLSISDTAETPSSAP